MGQIDGILVGNDFAIARARLQAPAKPVKISYVRDEEVMAERSTEATPQEDISPVTSVEHKTGVLKRGLNLAHQHSFIVFTALFFVVAVGAIEVGAAYVSAQHPLKSNLPTPKIAAAASGLNLSVPSSQLDSTINKIIDQPATLKVGDQTATISPATIKSWLTITPSKDSSQDYIHVDSATMVSSLTAMAQKYVVAPVDQVTINVTGTNQTIAAGQNGTSLTDPDTIKSQVASTAKDVTNASGLNYTTPLGTQAFATKTPSDYPKFLAADVTTNRLYAFEGSNTPIQTFLSSDGKPGDLTPIGLFHIRVKLTSQTMKGPGYVQPNVPWVNYFDNNGDAIHGVYWRPASIFGVQSMSHGCVGLQVNNAEWVYNWAPVGTPVVTYRD